MGKPVDLEVGDLDHVGAYHGATSHQRLDSQKQLRESEGLGEVVVRTGLEALGLVDHRVARGQDKDGHDLVLAAHALEDLGAGEPWQHEVKDEDVVVEALRGFPCRLPVVDNVHRITLGPQAARDDVRQLLLILRE